MKSLFYFPSEFKDRLFEVHKEKGLQWLEKLPDLIASFSTRWDFRFISPIKDLSYGYVAVVEYKGRPAILKLNPDPHLIAKETEWLKGFAELTPKILEDASDEGAFLMEQIIPGSSLKGVYETGDDERATRIICQTVKRLQALPFTGDKSKFPHLSEMTQMSLLRGRFDQDLVQKAESLFLDLTKKSPSDVVLHGDLHHDNILSSGSDWKIIDPHGYLGDPVFEIAPFMYNPLDQLPNEKNLEGVLETRLQILKDEMSFDMERIKAWAFCMVMLSMAWTVEGTGELPLFPAKAARILAKFL